jgi:Reverse transcriptase (RNA-dependent DNA polymerase)
LRFAVDYRKLNSISKHDRYLSPKIDSCLDTLNRSCFCSTLGLRSAYWRAAMNEQDAEKTSSVIRKRCFKFNVLLYGLTGAPGLFQRLMDLILSGLTWDICLVYVDDVIAFSHTLDDHLKRLDMVREYIRLISKLSIKSANFCSQKIAFLASLSIQMAWRLTNREQTPYATGEDHAM